MPHHLEPETIITLLASLAVILASAELFTNGIEWLGHRLNLAEGAVGSVLAAVGTALPETLIPFVAILIRGGETGSEIGIGAILGAPLMLGTLAMFVTGLAALGYRRRRPEGLHIVVSRRVLTRDLAFFLIMYATAIGVSFAPRLVRQAHCFVLLLAYGYYLRQTFADPQVANNDLQSLRLQRLIARWHCRRGEGEAVQDYLERLHSAANGAPRIRVIAGQVLLALAGIVGGAYIFVGAAEQTAHALGVAPLLIALIIAPVATELPEKFNSIVWMRQGKDTYALGNITGAMVFQSTFPVSLGMWFTSWRLLAPAGHEQAALHSAVIALAGGVWLLGAGLLARRTEGPAGGVHLRLNPAVLLVGGALYAAFLVPLLLRM